MLEKLHAEPMKIYSNNEDGECKGNQKTIVPAIGKETN